MSNSDTKFCNHFHQKLIMQCLNRKKGFVFCLFQTHRFNKCHSENRSTTASLKPSEVFLRVLGCVLFRIQHVLNTAIGVWTAEDLLGHPPQFLKKSRFFPLLSSTKARLVMGFFKNQVCVRHAPLLGCILSETDWVRVLLCCKFPLAGGNNL